MCLLLKCQILSHGTPSKALRYIFVNSFCLLKKYQLKWCQFNQVILYQQKNNFEANEKINNKKNKKNFLMSIHQFSLHSLE